MVPAGVYLQHWHFGPRDLAAWASKQVLLGGSAWTMFQIPYLAYLPYSIVNYAVIGTPVMVIGIFAITTDWYLIRKSALSLVTDISAASNEENALKIFNRFVSVCSSGVGRYGSFVLGLAVVVTYEKYLGRYTLTSSGAMWALIAYALVGLYAILIAATMFYYHHGFRDAIAHIARVDGDVMDFTNRAGTVRFVQHILLRHWTIVIALALFGVLLPVLEALGAFG
jgi:hypothetical protein